MELQFHFFFKLQTEYLYLIMTSFVALHVAHPIGVGQVMGSIISANYVIAKDFKNCSYCFYVRSGTCQVSVIDNMSGGMPLPKKSTFQHHAQLGIPDNGRAIRGLVECYLVWLGSIGLWTKAVHCKVHESGPLLWSGFLSRRSTITFEMSTQPFLNI